MACWALCACSGGVLSLHRACEVTGTEASQRQWIPVFGLYILFLEWTFLKGLWAFHHSAPCLPPQCFLKCHLHRHRVCVTWPVLCGFMRPWCSPWAESLRNHHTIARPSGDGGAELGGGNSLRRARLESGFCHLSVTWLSASYWASVSLCQNLDDNTQTFELMRLKLNRE